MTEPPIRFNAPIAPDADQTNEPPADAPPPLLETLGGTWGMAESGLPAVVFVVAYTISGSDTELSAIAAVAFAGLLALVRLVRREHPRHALAGLVGVAFAAFIATRTGRAEDFFLPGLLINIAYALAMVGSIAAGWPLIGVIAGQLDGSRLTWRADRVRRSLMVRATWLWAAMFTLRVAVQMPMYLAGAVIALGIARTAMGLPLYALTVWITYTWLRAGPASPDAEADGSPADATPPERGPVR